jgi:Flp pilus assembly protein CpaB
MRRRWSPISRIFAALSVLAGVAAFLLASGYAKSVRAAYPDVGTPVPVVVASRALARGTVLGEDMLSVRSVPSSFAPPGALSSPARAVGRVLTSDVAEGESVTRTRLAAPGVGPVAAVVPSGLRAFAIHVWLPPRSVHARDRVDVLVTFGGPRAHTETVATDVEILAVVPPATPGDGLAGGGPSGETALVLLTSPTAAESLAYASAFGTVAVSIVPPTSGV